LVAYGAADTVVLPSMAKVIQDHTHNCQMSEYPGVGHAPFIEEPIRFNAELTAFARRIDGTS
jgi:pimeloyl-ACP methyl ester carboxylesterase